jgi:SAM-dependent methyltransferase
MTRRYNPGGILLLLILLLQYVQLCHSFTTLSFPKRDRSRKALKSEKSSSLYTHSSDSRRDDLPIVITEDANLELARFLDSNTTLQMEGYISKRRVFGSSLAFLDLVVNNGEVVQVILRRDVYLGDQFGAYFSGLQPGVVIQLNGYSGPSRTSGEILLFCTRANILRPNGNPQHLRKLLALVREGELVTEQVARAIQLTDTELIKHLEETPDGDNDALYSLAKQLLEPLPNLLDPSKLMGSSKGAKIELLPAVPKELSKPPANWKMSEELAISESPQSVQDIMAANDCTEGDNVLLNGWVQNRLRFQDSVTVLEIVDSYSSTSSDDDAVGWSKRIKCVIHPMVTPGNLKIHGNLLCPGARVLVPGRLEVCPKTKQKSLWATSEPQLLRSSARLQAVRYLLDLAHQGYVDSEDLSMALQVSLDQAQDVASVDSPSKRQWIAADLTRELQDTTSRRGSTTPEMEASLERTASKREEYPLVPTEIGDILSYPKLGETKSASLTKGSLLRVSSQGSKWQRAKLPQLQWMIAQIKDVLESHPDYNQRRLSIVDIGGGRGHLANLVAEEFSQVADVRVVDISQRSINNGMMSAKRNQLENIRFDVADAMKVKLTGVDVIVALHACGALSDVAIGHAVTNRASFVVCPCCFRSNSHLKVPSHCGGLVPVSDWLQIDDKQMVALQQVAEIQGDMKMAGKAIHSICALRAASAQHHYNSSIEEGVTLQVSIKTFPIGFSTRNFCIVGRMHTAPK